MSLPAYRSDHGRLTTIDVRNDLVFSPEADAIPPDVGDVVQRNDKRRFVAGRQGPKVQWPLQAGEKCTASVEYEHHDIHARQLTACTRITDQPRDGQPIFCELVTQ